MGDVAEDRQSGFSLSNSTDDVWVEPEVAPDLDDALNESVWLEKRTSGDWTIKNEFSTNVYEDIVSFQVTGADALGNDTQRHFDLHFAPFEVGWRLVIPGLSPRRDGGGNGIRRERQGRTALRNFLRAVLLRSLMERCKKECPLFSQKEEALTLRRF